MDNQSILLYKYMYISFFDLKGEEEGRVKISKLRQARGIIFDV